MKRILHIFALLLVVLVGCQKEPGSREVSVSFPLEWDGATKASGDGSRADRLLAGVYEKDASGNLTFLPELSMASMQEAMAVSGGAATYKATLTLGKEYVLVFWAQSRNNQDYQFDFQSGTMTVASSVPGNNEDGDAFYAVFETGPVSADAAFSGITLTRPFARFSVTVPQEDQQLAERAGVRLSRSAMRVQHVPSTLDLLSGKVSGEADIRFEAAAVPDGEVAFNYVLAGEERLYNVDLEVYTQQNGTEASPVSFQISNVKGRRNYRTRITGNVFTVETGFQVSLEADWNGTGYEGNIPTPDVEPDDPGTPDDPDDPDDPDQPDNPDNPDQPDNPDDPDNPDNPDTPDNPDDPDQPDDPDNPDDPDDPDDPEDLPSATGTVVTQSATDISSVEARLNAQYYGATGEIVDMGFYWGYSSGRMDSAVYAELSPEKSGTFSAVLSSLSPGTTYYYQAFIVEFDAAQGKYVDRLGAVMTFQTPSQGGDIDPDNPDNPDDPGDQPQTSWPGYLGCFEVPAVSLDGTVDKGDKYGPWWGYGTSNSQQRVVTHAYNYSGKQYRNYTTLVDGSKKAPLWSAHVMHRGAYPDNNIGRVGSWAYDPAVPSSWQQTGVSSVSGGSGFSRGHFVASNDRQACADANYQTFFYTNQAPQFQNKFNDGVWNSLEQAIQNNAPSGTDTLYVVTGVLYEGSSMAGSVPIPSHFYKLLMKCSFSGGTMTAAKGVAYLFENRAYSTSYTANVTTIDAVEQRSGFDFFANVPKALQDAAEKTSGSVW